MRPGKERATLPNHDDLAVVLNRDPVCLVGRAEVGCLAAVAGEARVERAVGVVARESEVAGGALADRKEWPTVPNRDDLAVVLNRHGVCMIPDPPKLVVCLPSPEKPASSEPSRL